MVANVRRRLYSAYVRKYSGSKDGCVHGLVHFVRRQVEGVVNQVLSDTGEHVQARQDVVDVVVDIRLGPQVSKGCGISKAASLRGRSSTCDSCIQQP